MPVSHYFKGKGEMVLKDLVKQYGEVKGKAIFYALAHKHNLTPKGDRKR